MINPSVNHVKYIYQNKSQMQKLTMMLLLWVKSDLIFSAFGQVHSRVKISKLLKGHLGPKLGLRSVCLWICKWWIFGPEGKEAFKPVYTQGWRPLNLFGPTYTRWDGAEAPDLLVYLNILTKTKIIYIQIYIQQHLLDWNLVASGVNDEEVAVNGDE